MKTKANTATSLGHKSVANSFTREKGNHVPAYQFDDQRQEAVAQRRVQGMVSLPEKNAELAQLQAKAKQFAVKQPQIVQRKVQNTGHDQSQLGIGVVPVIQRHVSTAIGNEEVTVNDQDAAPTTMAFLTPNNSNVGAMQNDSSPVHLTKNVNKGNMVAKINAANQANAAALTHASVRAENAPELNAHLTLTSGFMTAALCDSRITRYVVKVGKAAAIWTHHNVTTQALSQNKLLANQIVGEYFQDLGLAMAANFDNLMFVHDPGGAGPTFANVVAFHDAIHQNLNSLPDQGHVEAVPFANVSYPTMRAQVDAGGAAMAAQWGNWTNGGNAAQLGDFRMPQAKWIDLAKAANILTRLRTKVLRLRWLRGNNLEDPQISNNPFDRNFIHQNLFGGAIGHNPELNTIEGNMNAHHHTHREELGEVSRAQMEALVRQNVYNADTVDFTKLRLLQYLYLAVRDFHGKVELPAQFGPGASLEANEEPGEAPLIIWYDAQDH